MQVIRSIKNQYYGINAHLHSYWQTMGGWSGFHGNHIADLMRALRTQLLPMGYTAEYQTSLQIRRLDSRPQKPASDIMIYDLDLVRAMKPSAPLPHPPTGLLVLPAPQVLSEQQLSEKEYGAIAVYEFVKNEDDLGEPIVWIELLSPSNKGASQDAETYREKRSQIIHKGVVFVEVDYLHESAPTLAGVADYRTHRRQTAQPGSHAYRIAVIDPRPTLAAGQAYIAQFDVDDPIPTVDVPLNAGEFLQFNFNVPYKKTLEETLYAWQLVDYSQAPLRFDRYSLADQTRIANRMLTVLTAAHEGVDLETGPFPAATLPLEAALAEVTKLQQ